MALILQEIKKSKEYKTCAQTPLFKRDIKGLLGRINEKLKDNLDLLEPFIETYGWDAVFALLKEKIEQEYSPEKRFEYWKLLALYCEKRLKQLEEMKKEYEKLRGHQLDVFEGFENIIKEANDEIKRLRR